MFSNIIKEKYDVVFALSFFSHIPDKVFGEWIKALYEVVKPGGVLIFTTHGTLFKNRFNKMTTNGFSFDLASEQKDLATEEYGSTVSEYEYVERKCKENICKIPEIFEEGFWWKIQDLYIIRKE